MTGVQPCPGPLVVSLGERGGSWQGLRGWGVEPHGALVSASAAGVADVEAGVLYTLYGLLCSVIGLLAGPLIDAIDPAGEAGR